MFRATITVPSIQQNGEVVEDLLIVQNVVRNQLCSWFGGCTATVGKGSWVNENGVTVTEDVTVFETVTDNGKVLPIVEGIANHVKEVCNQEAVLVTVQKMDTVRFV
jgi:hypothetical protein